MAPELYPYLFDPIYKPYPWGGDRFARLLGRPLPAGPWAESWEIADRPEGQSILRNGPLAGRSLADLVGLLGDSLTGAGSGPASRFPLLFKLLDARGRTSLQVHPTPEGAPALGGETKTELWYVLPGNESGRVFAGLQPGVDRARFAAALQTGRLAPLLRAVPILAGQAVFIPAGRLHAIEAGCFLYEIQLNSDTTYRVHDWDRRGEEGRSRPLHVEQALAVIRWDDSTASAADPRFLRADGANLTWEIHRSAHFRVSKMVLAQPQPIRHDGTSFQVLYVERGAIAIEGGGRRESLATGSSCLIPSGLGSYELAPDRAAGASVILTTR